MATSEVPSPSTKLSLVSYQTALCVVPPSHLSQDIDRLRSQYDQAYEAWPAHINIVYPFVPVDLLPVATELIQKTLNAVHGESHITHVPIRLDNAGYFPQRNANTVHLKPAEDQGADSLKDMRRSILAALGQADIEERPYNPHLTIGQTKFDKASLDLLLNKVNLLSSISWKVEKLLVLVRERNTDPSSRGSGKMRIWGTVDLSENASSNEVAPSLGGKEGGRLSLQSLRQPIEESKSPNPNLETRTTYRFSPDEGLWVPLSASAEETSLKDHAGHRNLVISSYNVLADSSPPPSMDRYDKLLQNILADEASADILVLQEVCDEFLTRLLKDDAVRIRYPFASHGPPHQEGIPPLPSLRNIAVLSKWEFSWDWLPFETRHKGAAIVKMHNIGSFNSTRFVPLIIAAINLTSGLTDSAVRLKSAQLHSLFDLLDKDHSINPRVIAGDFNVTTSSLSIENALMRKSITRDTVNAIQRMESLLYDFRYSDAWVVCRRDFGDEPNTYQGHPSAESYSGGEFGATFDPKWNSLAAQSATSDANAQRYDRILVHDGNNLMKAVGLNFFGTPALNSDGDNQETIQLGSDHWGIRAKIRLDQRFGQLQEEPDLVGDLTESASEMIRHVSATLCNTNDFMLCLNGITPAEEEAEKRKSVFNNVRKVITGEAVREADESNQAPEPRVAMVVVPVGSYGLGTWNTGSDIDCLCVGSISSKTFFALATQRIRKASHIGIRILRKVKAATGTMLELELDGVKLDLQYCPAASAVERWQEIATLPPDDPLFYLSPHALSKLQPFRDQEYIKRIVPDLDTLRLAIRFITAWAKRCGIYSSKFGYLGGIHITMMVSSLYKRLYDDGVGRITLPELVCSFFHHYANFNWENPLELIPGTHNRYRRLPSESMVILAHHLPATNVARAIAAPSSRTIIAELKRADAMLSEPGMTWENIMVGEALPNDKGVEAASTGPKTFLAEHTSYVKINMQYWGRSPSKGAALLGWLESRFFRLLIDFDRRLPSIHPRIWPARFTSKDTIDDDNDDGETEFQCCYLIGLTRRSNADLDKEERKKAQQTLQLILDSFTAHIQDSPAYYNPETSWVEIAHVKQSELGELKLDNRSFANRTIEELDSDDEDEEEGIYDEPLDEEMDDFFGSQPLSGPSRNRLNSGTGTSGVSEPKSKHKLRPAIDVLTRLRWDPNIDPSDYIVGYEDRFLGARETPIDRWKSEQTDEEFIPQHRILYFRRKSDGVKVWDRESRRDELFGSGAGRSD